MNLTASENCTTAPVSLRSLRLKWSFEILLNEETEPRCLVISAFWPLNISKVKPNRNQLLQGLSGRREEVMRDEEGMMVGQEQWKRK